MTNNIESTTDRKPQQPLFAIPVVVRWFFIAIGGKFYMDWILPTNPTSKNKLIILLWGGKKRHCWTWDYKNRIKFCYIYGGIHIVFAILNAISGTFLSVGNILVNIYPIIVQLYIFYRCVRVLNLRTTSYINTSKN